MLGRWLLRVRDFLLILHHNKPSVACFTVGLLCWQRMRSKTTYVTIWNMLKRTNPSAYAEFFKVYGGLGRNRPGAEDAKHHPAIDSSFCPLNQKVSSFSCQLPLSPRWQYFCLKEQHCHPLSTCPNFWNPL